MSNFSPKLEEASDKELRYMINELDFQVVPLASDELTRRALDSLHKTIEIFNKQSSVQTEKLIKLTWWIVILTIIMVLGLVIQIKLSL